MIKKRVLSLILSLMIVVCCVAEAFVIGELKEQNNEMEKRLEQLSSAIEGNSAAISELDSQMETKLEKEIPTVFLPGDIYVCEGMTAEIYNASVCSGVNPENYEFYWDCEIGDCMNDKYRIHAKDGMTGEYELSVNLYDYQMEQVATASTVLHVVPNVFGNEDTGMLNILTIGDSLSASTPWLSYTRELSGEKLYHLGTRGDTEGLMNEGIPGISAGEYFAGTLYGAESPNAFTNPQTGEFDWNYYKQSTGIEPDVVQVFLGTNGLEMDPSGNADNILKIVDKIKEADSNIQILVVEPIFPADQDGMARQQNIMGYEGLHGMWSYARGVMVFNLISELEARLDSYENVTIVPAGVMLDRAYGFEQTEIRKNPHSEVLESVPAQGVHPGEAGYNQIGDAIYATLCYLIHEGKIETTPLEESLE